MRTKGRYPLAYLGLILLCYGIMQIIQTKKSGKTAPIGRAVLISVLGAVLLFVQVVLSQILQ